MAQAKTARGTALLVKVGNGATPEVFAHNCTINGQRALQFSAQTNDVNVPDCDTPEQLAWVEREKVSVGAQITGEGVLNTTDLATYFDWVTGEDTKNVKVVVDVPSGDGGRIMSGAFHCTQFDISGNRGEKVTASITLQSSGAVTIANNA